MILKLKGGTTFGKLSPQGVLIAVVVSTVYEEMGLAECVITSGDDPGHMENSLHYKGEALDFRTEGLTGATVATIIKLVKGSLGTDFDVILEAKDIPIAGDKTVRVTHMHVEYDPKTTTPIPVGRVV